MRAGFRFLFIFLFIPSLCWAELIYNPLTKEPVYDYTGDFEDFKRDDFVCLPPTEGFKCVPFNLQNPRDFLNGGIPLDGFDFWAWERGYNIPKKPYKIFSFMIKRDGEFVWYPYSLEEINNLMGN